MLLEIKYQLLKIRDNSVFYTFVSSFSCVNSHLCEYTAVMTKSQSFTRKLNIYSHGMVWIPEFCLEQRW